MKILDFRSIGAIRCAVKKYNLRVKVEKLKQPRGFELKKDVFGVNGTFYKKF